MSVKQTDKLEQEFKEYSELTPSENKIIELESNVLVILVVLWFCCLHVYTTKRQYTKFASFERTSRENWDDWFT